MKTVIGAFDNSAQAEKAVQDLVNSGMDRSDISLIANNEGGRYAPMADTTSQTTANTGEAIGHDAIVGAEWGAGIGLLVGLTGLAIPGLGWVAGAGWLMATLVGAGTGAIVGGLVGALTQVGVPESDAANYSEAVRRGGYLLAVRANDADARSVAEILDDNGAINIDERAAQYQQNDFLPTPATPLTNASATTSIDTPPVPITNRPPAPAAPIPSTGKTYVEAKEGETVLPVIEEEIQVGKRAVERGGVRVYSHVTEQPVEENVRLREEHVTVDRRPVDRPVSPADLNALRDQTIEVTEHAEEPVIAKQARIVEEVVVGKEAMERTETVRDTVRRTDVEVEQIPGSEHISRTGAASSAYDNYTNDFRRDWQTNYANAGGRYEDYEPSYRYGYDLLRNPKHQGRNWNQIENDVRSEWNTRYPNSWDRMKNSIRYAYDRATSGRIPGEGSVPGIQTGGHGLDGTPDTRGITEKLADTVTGDRIDDKTGKPV